MRAEARRQYEAGQAGLRNVGLLPDQAEVRPVVAPQSQVPITPVGGKVPGQPVSLNDLHPEDKKLAEMNLPRPRSKADRDQLPPGTKYIAPDGTIWTKQ
jgi:hypothetical protein